jgi:hypothetical protein
VQALPNLRKGEKMELDPHIKRIIRAGQKDQFAEIPNGNLCIEFVINNKEYTIKGICRIDNGATINGKTVLFAEQTDGSIVVIPANYDMITFFIED